MASTSYQDCVRKLPPRVPVGLLNLKHGGNVDYMQ